MYNFVKFRNKFYIVCEYISKFIMILSSKYVKDVKNIRITSKRGYNYAGRHFDLTPLTLILSLNIHLGMSDETHGAIMLL